MIDEDRYGPLWAAASAVIVVLAVLLLPDGRRFPAAALTASGFALMQIVAPSVRVRRRVLLSPVNFAVFLFYMQLIVLPLSLIVGGVGQATLPFLPTDRAINAAMLLVLTAHIAFVTGFSTHYARPRRDAARTDQVAWQPPRSMLWWFAGLGTLGLMMTFGSPAGLLRYFRSAKEAVLLLESISSTVPGLLGTLLRPFLQTAAILVWCGWADRRGAVAPFAERARVTILTTVAVVLVGSTFFYSRSAMVYPLLPLIGVYSLRVRRISVPAFAAGGLGLLFPLIMFGAYRSSGLQISQVGTDVALALLRSVDILAYIQLYAQGPQFLGFLMQQAGFGSILYFGTTLFASVMHPVPVLGAAFRSWSGVAVYNRMIYGPYEIPDQIIPFVGELFLNLHVGGVLLGFLIMGALVSVFQRSFESARTSADAFLLLYASIWFLFLLQGSVAVISQVAMYSMWPAYVYYMWRRSSMERARRLNSASAGFVSKGFAL